MKRDMTDLKKLVLDMMENREMPISGDKHRLFGIYTMMKEVQLRPK